MAFDLVNVVISKFKITSVACIFTYQLSTVKKT
jgi:hypothetical protein